MKVAILTPGNLPQPAVKGGAVEGLVDILIDYNERLHLCDLTVYSIYDRKAEQTAAKYRHVSFQYVRRNALTRWLLKKRFFPIHWFYKQYARKSSKLIKKQLFDLVCIQNEYIFAPYIRKALPNATIVLHLHNDYINSRNMDRPTRYLDGIVTISNYLRCRVRELDPDIPVKTVYNGVNLSLFSVPRDQKTRETVRKKYGVAQEDVVLVFAGRISPEKGVLELVEAFCGLKRPHLKLIIAGSSGFQGSSETLYTRRVREKARRRASDILFLGFVEHSRLPEIYQMADIGCVPSMWEEPFGLTAVEQLASGLPLITSDGGALPEIVDDRCAVIVRRGPDFTERLRVAIAELVADPERRKRMGSFSAEKASPLDQDIYARNLFDFLFLLHRNKSGDPGDLVC